jgi:hypothetical protein
VTALRFYQREIKRFNLTEDGRHILSADLSCGHTEPYKKRRPAGSKRTAMPCSQCGFMQRVPWERQRTISRMDRIIVSATRSHAGRHALVRLCTTALRIISTRPLGKDQRKLWDEINEAAEAIGLRGVQPQAKGAR